MDPHKRNALASADWEAISEELYGLVLWYLNRMTWKNKTVHILPEGKEPADIVCDLIAKVFSEDRSWDPDKVDLLTFLRSQIRSEVSNLVRSHAHQKEESLDLPESAEEISLLEKQASASNLKKSVEETVEEKLVAAEVKDAVFEAVAGDKELERFLELILDGYWKETSEIAECMGISVQEANNIKRRFLGRLSKVKEDLIEREANERAKIDTN